MFGKTISRLKKKRNISGQFPIAEPATETGAEDELEPIKATLSNSSAVLSSCPSSPTKVLVSPVPEKVAEKVEEIPVKVQEPVQEKIQEKKHQEEEVMAPASIVSQSNGSAAVSKKAAKAAAVTVTVTHAEELSQESSSSEAEVTETRSSVSTVVVKQKTESSTVSVAAQYVSGLITNLGEYEATMLRQTDLDSYLDSIADERLIHMPRKGSEWDRVLRTAQFFGLQIWRFGEKVGKFAPQSREAAAAALASCRMLLEIGHQHAAALLPAFMALYELGLLVSQITQIPGIFESDRAIKDDISRLYGDLVKLAGRVAVYYRRNISGLGQRRQQQQQQQQQQQRVTINLDAAFGQYIEAIWASKAALYERIWRQSMGRQTFALGLAELRGRLNDDATAFRHALYAELSEDLERAEDTCEWVKADLADFLQSGDKFLSVTGGPGSGKTVLADWIEERLQRPLHSTTYSVLLYTFPYDDHEAASVLGFLKGVLFQLLERSVGNMKLYQSLVSAFASSEQQEQKQQVVALVAALWKALQVGLNTFKKSEEPIVLLLDGLDEAAGGQQSAVAGFVQLLRQNVATAKNVRIITFARHDRQIAGARKIAMTTQELTPDIRNFLRQTLSRSQAFYSELAPAAREAVIDGLAQKAKGSFLWARLAGNYLLQLRKTTTTTADELVKAAAAISPNVDDVLQLVVARLDLAGDRDLARLLTFLAVGDGVLAEADAADLLAVDVAAQTLTRGGAPVDVAQLVFHTVPDLVLVRDGHVRFKSSLIRQHVQRQLGRALPPAKDAHAQLVLHLLLYAKLSIGDAAAAAAYREPTAEELDEAVSRRLLQRHRLLPFVMARWVQHFRASSLVQSGGDLALSHDFRAVFPDTAVFALLERQVWALSLSPADLVAQLTLTLRIREKVFGEHKALHVAVLQSLIVLGQVHLAAGHIVEGARYLYRAVAAGRASLAAFSPVIITCTDLFLSASASIVFTSRTDIFKYREELIRFKIETIKARYGVYSELVTVWYRTLAAMYVAVKEEHHAAVVYRELHDITVVLHGSDSQEAREITTFVGGLDVDLQDSETKKEIQGFGHELLVTAESLDDKDVLRVSIELNAARSYESEQQWQLAERVYIGLWRRVSALTHTSATVAASVDVHAAKLQVALAYTGFLRTQKRVDEAANILIVVWTEYEHYKFTSEELVAYLRDVAVLLREVGLLVVSASILSKVWTWYREQGRADDEVARKTTVLVTEVVREITETTVTRKVTALTTTTTSTTTVQTTEETETVVREVFQAELKRCSHDRKALDATFFTSALALVSTHMARGRWEEAETAILRSLEASWPELMQNYHTDKSTGAGRLSATFSHETVRLATMLADGYSEHRQFEKAEGVHLRMYQAASASLAPDAGLFVQVLGGLVAFYEAHHRHEAVVDVYVGLVQQYRSKLSATHALTIRALYTLAAQHELLGRSREAVACYGEVAAALNAGRTYVHPDAFAASVALVRHYYRAENKKRWAELSVVSTLLWETFVRHRAESASYVFSDDVAALAYEAHAGVLEHHGRADVAVLYQAATQYRESAVAAFGASSSAVVVALLALAAVAERSEKHQLEALSIYEEVLTRSKTTKTTTSTTTTTTTSTIVIAETTVQTVRRRLSQLYVTVITSGSSNSKERAKALPAGTVERAVVVSLEAYAQLRQEHGVWHDVALGKLRDVVVLLQRVGTKESQARLTQLVQSAVVDIVSPQAAVTTVQLYKAATTLATVVFVSTGLVTAGHELLRQLRLLLIFGNALPVGVSAAPPPTFTLPAGVHSRAVFLFLAAFEQRLTGSADKAGAAASFSELLSSLLYEAFLYDEYRAAFASSTTTTSSTDVVVVGGIEQLLQHGARLRRFWAEDGKAELVRMLDAQLFPVFKRAYGAQVKAVAGTGVADEHLALFYAALLVELGKDRAKAGFAVVAASAGIAQVRQLLEAADYTRALEVGRFVHVFCATQAYYRSATATTDGAGIGYGYRLAGLLAGLDVRTKDGSAAAAAAVATPPALREKLLTLSRTVTAELFAVLEAQSIDLAALEVADVDGLVRLLGAQADYARLEMLLLRLWQSREVRRNWRPATVLSIGFALVHAYAGDKKSGNGGGKLDRAIELADLLCYNLRRSRGWLDHDALAAGQLLASLYVEAGRVADAMAVYENVLRQIEAAASGTVAGSGSRIKQAASAGSHHHHHVEDADGDRSALAVHARQQLELLRAAHVRLGRWIKPKKEYQELYDHLREILALQSQLPLPFDKWVAAAMTASSANSNSKAALPGCYVLPSVLKIEDSVLVAMPTAPVPVGAK